MTDHAPNEERTAGDSAPAGRRQHASLDVAPELYDAGTDASTSQPTTAQRRSISHRPTTESR